MAICRKLLGDVRSGNLADFDDFGDKFDRDFGQLSLVPADELDAQSRIKYQRQLRELERIRIQLFKELADRRGDFVRRLSDISKGQVGLGAYKATLTGIRNGVHHAQG